MSWRDYFKPTDKCPARLYIRRGVVLDFSRADIPVEEIEDLFERGLPYFELTAKGKEKLYGINPDANNTPEETKEAGDSNPPKKSTTKKQTKKKAPPEK